LDEVSTGLNSDAVVSNRASVTPILWTGGNGGNASCSDVDGGGWSNTSVRNNYNYQNGTFENEWPSGFSVTVKDGKYVDWSFSPPSGMCVARLAVIVKGGDNANIYLYKDGQTSDTNLCAPVNASENLADLSNLTFCWDLKPCNVTDCDEETAYGGNNYGVRKPGWWWYLDTGNPQSTTTADIHAGDANNVGMVIGTVTYANGKITINLNSNSQLQQVSEAVKIQGYNSIPSSRPISGKFTTYKGDTLMDIPVGNYRYYVIHLDVVVCK
jgi:hypothetical protein